MYNDTNILEKIEKSDANLTAIRKNLLVPTRLQLHTGLEGFNSPESYGIYRNTGGDALGVVGSVFEPMDLNLFLTAIEQSVNGMSNMDLSKLTYTEYKNGAKVVFNLPLKKYELKTPMVGDIIETSLQFKTGFDGMTKNSLGFYTNRLWCANGAANWQKDIELAFKNTLKNQVKLTMFTAEILKAIDAVENDVKMLDKAVLMPIVSQEQMDKFLTDLTGYDVKDYKNLTTRRRTILDAINNSMAIETANTGNNLFSLLQGVTRYTTHNVSGGSTEKILFSNAHDLNKRAYALVATALN